MTTLNKLNVALIELEKAHGAMIPLADLKQTLAKLFEQEASDSLAAPSKGEQCVSMTKASIPKQCSKQGTNLGTDNKNYCTLHFKTEFPDLAKTAAESKPVKAAKASSSSSSPPSAAKKPAAAKTVVGKGSLNPTCEHAIGGKNPRSCTSTGKCQGSDGKWYCGTHVKSHTAATGAIGIANDVLASAKMSQANQKPNLQIDDESGLAIDQNGICYIGDYDNKGPSAVAHRRANLLVELSAEDMVYCEKHDIPVVPSEERTRIIALAPEERKKLVEPSSE